MDFLTWAKNTLDLSHCKTKNEKTAFYNRKVNLETSVGYIVLLLPEFHLHNIYMESANKTAKKYIHF